MEAILDANFIISCLLKRIDFLEELRLMGFKPVVPKEVLQELKGLRLGDKTSHEERGMIEIAFKLFDEYKIKKIRLGGRNVDEGLIKKGKEGAYIATLDREIKTKIPNKIVILGNRKKLAVERS